MFHFNGFQSVSKDCLHVPMQHPTILSKSSDYAVMFKFQYKLTKKKSISVHINPLQLAQNALEGPVLDPILESFSLVPLPHSPADSTPWP